MAHRVTLIPGDGTGPELTEATRRVLEATGVEFDWDVQPAGADVMDEHGGNPLAGARRSSRSATNGVALKGPITTPVGGGFRSVNVGLRKSLDLYAQVRPCKSYPGVRSRFEDVDLVDRPREHRGPLRRHRVRAGDARRAGAHRLDRVARAARSAARLGHLDQADLGHRDAPHLRVRLRLCAPERPPQGHGGAQGEHHEVQRTGSGCDVAREVAAENPDVEFDDRIVDNMCMQLVQRPGGVRRARAARTSTATSSPTSAPG